MKQLNQQQGGSVMKLKTMIHLIAAVLVLLSVSSAHAAGTAAGTSIANTATVDFTVGGVSQPTATSNTATFLVDRRINLTVAESGGTATAVVPGSSSQVLTFTVTNSTNATMDFRLIAGQQAGGASPFGHTDNFDATGVSVFVDFNGNGTYEAGTDIATFLDEIPADTTKTVFIVANIPGGQVNGDAAGLRLTAVAAQSGGVGALGADSTETAGADTPASVDTVFGDVAGVTDASRDGRHSAADEYFVTTATISVTKTSTVISDPFNGVTNPKAIPGAVIEFCIQVSNTGSSTATNVIVSDTIPANTTFVSGSITAGGTVTAGVCNADGTVEDDNAAGGDETDPNGGSFAAGVVSTTVPSVAASAITTTRFRVTIN
jgi:uncharacterized repeat protein (TIGR01451 family)